MVVVKEIEENGEQNVSVAVDSSTTAQTKVEAVGGVSDTSSSKTESVNEETIKLNPPVDKMMDSSKNSGEPVKTSSEQKPALSSKTKIKSDDSSDSAAKTKAASAGGKQHFTDYSKVRKQLKSVNMSQTESFHKAKKEPKAVSMKQSVESLSKDKKKCEPDKSNEKLPKSKGKQCSDTVQHEQKVQDTVSAKDKVDKKKHEPEKTDEKLTKSSDKKDTSKMQQKVPDTVPTKEEIETKKCASGKSDETLQKSLDKKYSGIKQDGQKLPDTETVEEEVEKRSNEQNTASVVQETQKKSKHKSKKSKSKNKDNSEKHGTSECKPTEPLENNTTASDVNKSHSSQSSSLSENGKEIDCGSKCLGDNITKTGNQNSVIKSDIPEIREASKTDECEPKQKTETKKVHEKGASVLGRRIQVVKFDSSDESSVQEENTTSVKQTTLEQPRSTSTEQTRAVETKPVATGQTKQVTTEQTKNAEEKHVTSEPIRPVYNSKHWIKNVIERLKKAEVHNEVMLEFSQCKTDTQRFACLYMQPAVHEVIHIEEWNKEKSEVEARVLRTSGNKSFQKKHFKEALEMYSESILKAPMEPDSSELALAFANRSVVFYHLKMYVLCLQDIEFSLKYGYPEHNKYKLYERKGKCCYHLKMKEEAVLSVEQAIEFAEKAKLPENKINKLVYDLEKELDQIEKIKGSSVEIPIAKIFNKNHGPIPSVEGKLSSKIPCMSSSVVLRHTEQRGRGLFAERDIEVGEVLIVEKPYSSLILKGYELNHCHHCCNSLLAPLPCHYCSGVAFCSEECQTKAWESYHYAECKYLVLIEKADIGMSHLALRMVLKAGFNYIKQFEQDKEDTIYPLKKGCNKDGVYDSANYNTVYNLEGHSKDRSTTDLLQRTLTAIFLVKCLKRTSYFPPITAEESNSDFGKDEDEDHALVGSHILRHIQMLPCNAHEVSELEWNSSDFELSEVYEFGSAIYPVLSLINHSCDPSVVRHSYGDLCVVRAIRNIYKNEELLDNYGALYALTKGPQRQEKLFSQYYFHCDCTACKNDWPLYSDIPQECPVLKCKKCFGPIFIPSDGRNERAMCCGCREVHDITHDLLHLSRSEELYQCALEKTLKGQDLEENLPILIQHLRLLDPLLCRPWRDYNNCQEAIKQCYSTMGNCIKGKID